MAERQLPKLDAIAALCLLNSGYPWRSLPGEFPSWRTMHFYFAQWRKPDQGGISLLDRALKNQIGAARIQQGRNAWAGFLIVEGQSMKNPDSANLDRCDGTGGQVQSAAYLCGDIPALDHGAFLACLEQCRRLWANCERKLGTSLQFVHLAFLVMPIRRY